VKGVLTGGAGCIGSHLLRPLAAWERAATAGPETLHLAEQGRTLGS
jgi:nucleoside-diphosphate-sugar epimerase